MEKEKKGVLSVMTRHQKYAEEIIFDAESVKDKSIQQKIRDMLHVLDGRISFNKIITLTVKSGDEIIDISGAMFRNDIKILTKMMHNHFGSIPAD